MILDLSYNGIAGSGNGRCNSIQICARIYTNVLPVQVHLYLGVAIDCLHRFRYTACAAAAVHTLYLQFIHGITPSISELTVDLPTTGRSSSPLINCPLFEKSIVIDVFLLKICDQ